MGDLRRPELMAEFPLLMTQEHAVATARRFEQLAQGTDLRLSGFSAQGLLVCREKDLAYHQSRDSRKR